MAVSCRSVIVAKNSHLGLNIEYKNKGSDVGNILTYVFGLAFLEPEMVGECFAIDLASIQPSTVKVQTICDYLVDSALIFSTLNMDYICGAKPIYM